MMTQKPSLAANESTANSTVPCGGDDHPDRCVRTFAQAAPDAPDRPLASIPMSDLLDALTTDTQALVQAGPDQWQAYSFRSLRDVAAEIAARLA